MKKTLVSLFSGVLVAASAMAWQPANATANGGHEPPPQIRKARGFGMNGNFSNRQETNPLMSLIKTRGGTKTPFREELRTQVQSSRPVKQGVPIRKVSGNGRELYGNVVYQTGWTESTLPGLYSFNASAPITLTAKFSQKDIRANAGTALIGSQYHVMNSVGTQLYHSVYDVETGRLLTDREKVDDPTLIAWETAQDYATNKIYGLFYDKDMQKLEFGVADYTTMNRTTIGEATNRYVALGLTREGALYGIATDGNLYKVDTGTGAEQLVGSTGVAIRDEQGRHFQQTGEIDPTDNTFYWAAIDAQGVSSLYTVNLETGEATKISDFSAEEQIYGMIIPQENIAEGAPAAAAAFDPSFKHGYKSGVFHITAPTKTYGGADLPADVKLNYTIYIDDEEWKTGTVSPGKKTSKNIFSIDEGLHKFSVVLSNDVGNGPKVSVDKYVGNDTPKAMTNVKLEIDAATGKAYLTWDKPNEGINGGDVSKVLYDVVRYPDSLKVGEEVYENSFDETLDKSLLKRYYYGVTAVNSGKRGEEAFSNTVVFGEAIVPPYEETFETEADFNMFSVDNANNDDYTWTYDGMYKRAKYSYSDVDYADDWLITPKVRLQKGMFYTVTFNAWSGLESMPERMEVKYGTGKSPSELNKTFMKATTLPAYQNIVSKDLVADEDMDVYFGFHAVSEYGMFNLYLDDISISEGRSTTVPKAATNLKAQPVQGNPYSTVVSFNAPSESYAGDPLQAIKKIELLRDGSVINTFDNPTPGEELSFTDVLEASAEVTYTVVAYNEGGKGLVSGPLKVFVGEDVPESPKNITAKDNTTAIELGWDKVSEVGANGGTVNPDNVKYRIYDIVQNDEGTTTELKGETAETRYSIEMNTSEGEQSLLQFALDAYNVAGGSKKAITPAVVVGAPHTLPFVESFADGGMHYTSWWISTNGYSKFTLSDQMSVDGDGGSAMFPGYVANDSAWLNTGKISLGAATNPALVYSHCAKPGKKVSLTVQVMKPDGTVDELVKHDYATMTGTAAWTTDKVTLDQYKSQPYIIVKFLATTEEAGNALYIDGINLNDMLGNDLSASISVPETLTKGAAVQVAVTVANEGANDAEAYTVKLKADGNDVEEKEVNEPLASLSSRVFNFDYTPSVLSESGSVVLSAEVIFQSDAKTDNNTAQAEAKLEAPTLPAPETAKAEDTEAGVKVSWTMPASSTQTLTDDFESYDAWAYDGIGDWTMIDGDGAYTGGMFEGLDYPNQGQPFAFMVFNPELMYEGLTTRFPEFTPHSGGQYLMSVYSGNGSTIVDNDDWLISPALPGVAQTVTFYVSNLNIMDESGAELPSVHKFDVLASSTGKERADFTKVGETLTHDSQEWTKMTVELPEGTKYFAINNITDADNSMMLMIDDVTYTKGTDSPNGFNIYRDGEKLHTAAADATEYTDNEATSGKHRYAVTALYDEGESLPVTADITSGITEVDNAEGKAFNVYTLDGRLVGKDLKSLDLLRPGVYIANGKKIVVK